MAQGIEIASTTDSQADIERAIGLDPTAEALKEERERTQAAPEPEQPAEPDTEAQDRTLHGPISAQDSAHNGDSPRARGHVDDMTRKAFESLPNSKPPKV